MFEKRSPARKSRSGLRVLVRRRAKQAYSQIDGGSLAWYVVLQISVKFFVLEVQFRRQAQKQYIDIKRRKSEAISKLTHIKPDALFRSAGYFICDFLLKLIDL